MVFCSFILYLTLFRKIVETVNTGSVVVGGKMSPKDVLDYLDGPSGITRVLIGERQESDSSPV